MSHPLNTPIGRFGIETLEGTGDHAVASVPTHDLVNPLTGLPSAAPLAMLLDHVGGLVNHLRRRDDEWTVSTELSLELTPETADLVTADDAGVVARARPVAAMMAVEADGATALRQHADPVINNMLGIVHGGVAATGLELVASAAVNQGRTDAPLRTGSLRVNFLRRLIAGGECRYSATPLRLGRSTGVADAQAVGADGELALTARLTGYR